MRKTIPMWLLAAMSSGVFAQEALSIKGFEPGQPMTSCPSGAISSSQNGEQIMCNLGPTTYAGAAASAHAVALYKGEVIGVIVRLTDRGRYANSSVVAAMKERFGQPDISKDYLNSYIWKRGEIMLSFDGFSGQVLLADMQKNREARQNNAKTNRNDL
jgi:hypothetical protein